jgi:hypothetical protein
MQVLKSLLASGIARLLLGNRAAGTTDTLAYDRPDQTGVGQESRLAGEEIS